MLFAKMPPGMGGRLTPSNTFVNGIRRKRERGTGLRETGSEKEQSFSKDTLWMAILTNRGY